MPSELDTTIKRRIMSRNRLAEISHHFLSEHNEADPGRPGKQSSAWHNTQVIPVLLGNKSDDYIVYELDRAFNRQHFDSMVLNIEGHINSAYSSPVSEKFSAQSLAKEDSEQVLPPYCLVPVTSPATTLALRSERLVITVHASLPGVRIAYNQLAFLASLNTRFHVCVVMFGARSHEHAQRFFDFLDNNAQSMLHINLVCGGHLLAQELPDRDNSGCIEAARFIASTFSKARPTPTALEPVTGPAAYLS